MISLTYPVLHTAPVTQTFAEHEAFRVSHGWKYYNGGIDFAVTAGTPVRAAADGVVSIARMDNTGYGLHVRIYHDDGYLSLYGHLSGWLARVGQAVRAGDIIGHSGNTGNSTGPHLHFELRHNGSAIDPSPYFEAVEQPTPENSAPEQPTLTVTTGFGLLVRETPISGKPIGLLAYGETVTPISVWVETVGGWVCWRNGDGEYLSGGASDEPGMRKPE